MQSFLDVVMPPLLLTAFGLFACTVLTVLAVADPGLGAETRDQAIAAYQAVSTAIPQEHDNQ